jgi:hypothetical protein
MFCAWCGASTEVRESRLVCIATGMDFSEMARRELVSVAESPPRDVGRSRVRWGCSWHCPADATLMNEAEGRVTCPTCGRSMPPRLLYGLIELHVHPKPQSR